MSETKTAITARDLLELEVDLSTDKLRTVFEVGSDRTTHEFSLDSAKQDPRLAKLLGDLAGYLASEVQARRNDLRTPPCASCTGACCRGWDVRVTKKDADRLGKHASKIERYAQPLFTGEVGHMKKTDWKNPVTGEKEPACIMLGKDGRCTIYEVRPDACRAFSAWECEMLEEWPKTKKRLPLLRA